MSGQKQWCKSPNIQAKCTMPQLDPTLPAAWRQLIYVFHNQTLNGQVCHWRWAPSPLKGELVSEQFRHSTTNGL